MSDCGTPLLDKYQLEQMVNVSHRRLGDRAWRQRVGLPAILAGGTLRFDPHDVERWLEARRERVEGRPAA
jgi:hypothetical protein